MARPCLSSSNSDIFRILPSLLLVISSLLFPTVFAQSVTLIPSSASDSFPACGLSCPLLKQAQDGCVPPAAQVTNQETYVSCFCQSALITQLHSTGNGVCDAECTNPSDRSLLQTWYNNYCQSGGNAPTSTTTTAADPPSTTTSSVRTTPQWDAPQPWIKTHYRWVIMIVVLFVGFTIIGVGAMWLKRRHDAKNPGLYHGANRGGSSGTLFNNHHDSGATPGPPGSVPGPPGMCGPQQAMVHPLSSPSHYTNPESMASSSRTAVATPNLPDITEPRTPTPNTARSSSRFQKKPAGYGDVEIREV